MNTTSLHHTMPPTNPHTPPKTARKPRTSGGVHNLANHQIAIKFNHTLWRKIEIAAIGQSLCPGEFIRAIAASAVSGISLTCADERLVAERIATAKSVGKMV